MRKPTEVPPALKSIDVKAILRRRGIYDKQIKNKKLKEAARPLAEKLLKKKSQPIPIIKASEPRKFIHFTNDEALSYWRKQIHTVEINEAKFEKKVEQFIMKMVNGYLTHLDSEIGTTKSLIKKTKGYFDEVDDELQTSAQIDFAPILLAQAKASGQEAYLATGLRGTYNPDEYRKVIRENIDKFTASMIETDKEKLTSIISNGISAGYSIPEIRGQIQNDFESYSKTQASRITRTEVLRASNQASIDAYQQSGVVEAKQWLTAGATDECSQYEGQIVTLNDGFYGETNEFADGDPPLHPNCRCVVLPVVENSHPGQELSTPYCGVVSRDAMLVGMKTKGSDSVDCGDIELVDADLSETQTFYRGEGEPLSDVNTRGTDLFGYGFYVDRTRSQASIFGSTIYKYKDFNLPNSLIMTISTQEQYDAFQKDAIKYALSKGKNIDVQKAMPAYARHLGFKGIEATEAFDPRGGIAVVDPKLIKMLRALTEGQKSIDQEYNSINQRVKELEDQLDKRTKEFRDLRDKQLEDAEYVKELEGLLDEKRTITEDF